MEFTLIDKIVLCVAKRNSGKSYLCRWLVKQQRSHFHKLYLINPSESINNFWGQIVPKTCIFDTYNDEWLDCLIKKMTSVNEGKTQSSPDFKRVLLILDDVVADVSIHHSCPSLQVVIGRGRHCGVSLVFLSQSVTGVNPFLRNNSDFILLQMLNSASLDIAAHEWTSCGLDKNEFKQLHKKCTPDFGFMVISQCAGRSCEDLNEYYGIIKCPSGEFKK